MLPTAVDRDFVVPKLVLSSALARWLSGDGGAVGASRECRLDVAGTTLAGALDSLFRQHPGLRGYVLDEHGRIRHHVAVFIDGESIRSKSDLDVSLNEGSEVYIMQALSGG